jgi:Flp pilus assembly protein TadD
MKRVTRCVLLVAVLATIAGCGEKSGPSEAELAAQDKQVLAAGRANAAQARLAAAAHQLKRRRMLASLRTRRARRLRRARRVTGRTVLQSAGSSAVDLCAPIRGGGPASRRGLRLLRRQMLYGLNLRC